MSWLAMALVAIAPPQPLAQESTSEAPALETRRFALPFVQPPQLSVALRLLPYHRFGSEDYRREPEPKEGLTADRVLEIIERTIAPESWTDAGVSRSVEADQSLLVRTTPERLEQIGALLRHVSGALLRPQELEVELHPIASAEAAFEAPPALLEAREAERVLSRLREAGVTSEPRRWRLRAFPARWASGGGQRATSFVRELDVEICDGATQADPVIDVYRVGTIAHARASSGGSGTRLHFFFEHGQVLGEIGTRVLTTYRELHSEQGEFLQRKEEFLAQQPTIGFGTLALVARVPEGRALVLVQRIHGPRGFSGHVLHVKPLPHERSSQILELPEVAFAVRDVTDLTATRLSGSESLGCHLLTGGGYGEAEGSAYVEEPAYDGHSLLEHLEEAMDTTALEARLEVEEVAGLFVLRGTKARVEEALRWLDEREAQLGSVHDMRLEVRDRAGTRTFAEITIAACEGQDAFFSLGSDALAALDYDIEVACGTSTCDPQIEAVAHGLLGRVRIEPLDARIVLDLDLDLHWMSAEPRSVPMPAWKDLLLDIREGIALRLAEPFVLAQGESAETGDLDPSGAEGLVLRVTRR